MSTTISVPILLDARSNTWRTVEVPLELVMSPSDVRISEEISTYLGGYSNWEFRADEMSPVVPIDADTFKYRQMTKANTFRRVDVKRGIHDAVPLIDIASSVVEASVQYRAVDFMLNAITEEQNGLSRSPLNIRAAGARRCQRVILMDREYDVISFLTTSTNFASAQRTALAAGYEWNGGANSDPIRDLQYAHAVTSSPINHHWLNLKTAQYMWNHASFRDYMQTHLGQVGARELLSDARAGVTNRKKDFTMPLFGEFHIVEAKQENVTTGVLESMFPDGTIVMTGDMGNSTTGDDIATTKTFRKRGTGFGYETREFDLPVAGLKGSRVMALIQADKLVSTANDVGHIITGAVQ